MTHTSTSTNITATSNDPHEPTPETEAPPTSGVPATTLLFLALGTVLLIASAAALPHLSQWADDHGTIPVFLGFFLLMSLAGRWFWTGVDAILAAIRGNQ